MDRRPPGMAMDKDAIDIEIEKHGLSPESWILYLTVMLHVENIGGWYSATKLLAPMTVPTMPTILR
jgi:hypothetical protein